MELECAILGVGVRAIYWVLKFTGLLLKNLN